MWYLDLLCIPVCFEKQGANLYQLGPATDCQVTPTVRGPQCRFRWSMTPVAILNVHTLLDTYKPSLVRLISQRIAVQQQQVDTLCDPVPPCRAMPGWRNAHLLY